jgi:hypothetical protein
MSSAEERSVLLDELFERLPAWLELVDAAGLAPTLRDRRDGFTWRLFTADAFELGATAEKLGELEAAIARDPMILSPLKVHLPARRVKVEAFVMRERVVLDGEDDKILITNWVKQARAALEPFEARLPSEAEWERAWSVVQREPGGWVPSMYELCEDAWSIDRAELEHQAFVAGGPEVVRSGTFDRARVEWFLPERAPLKSARLATVRPTITCLK